MTRDEAIETLEEMIKLGDLYEVDIDACEIAIEALKQEPCEDAISRREAIKKFKYNYKGERIPDYDCDNFPVQISIKKVREILKKLPPVNPEPKTGHWIDKDENSAVCSCCNRNNTLYGDFCKWCGAKMESEKQA